MTTVSDRKHRSIDEVDIDRRPGSTDVQWAERAYRENGPGEQRTLRRIGPANLRHRVGALVPILHHRVRALVIALVVALVGIGVTLAMTYQGASPAGVVNRPTGVHSVIVPRSPGAARGNPKVTTKATLKPPLVRGIPGLFSTLSVPAR